MGMQAKKSSGYFPYFLGGIMLLFIGIMVFVYHGSKQANPVILDEKGQVRDDGTASERR